jgi:hypothetical protein
MTEFHLDGWLGTALVGAAAVVIKLIANMSSSLQEISLKIGHFHDILKDHENRLREGGL